MPVQNVFNPLLGRQRSVSDYLEEYDAADARKRNALLADEQIGATRQRNALLAMQMEQMQQEQQRAAAAEAARRAALSSASLDPRALYTAGVPTKDIEFLANAGNLGRPEVARTIERRGANGMPETLQLDRFGNPVGQALPKAVEMRLQDLGGRVQAVNPFALTPGQSFDKTMTAGERDASARGWAGLKQSADQFGQRLQFDKQEAARKADTTAKPLPPAALKMQQESLDSIGISSSVNADLAALDKQIDGGKLSFGPIGNTVSRARNAVGYSSEASRNFATFTATLERLRNESLRLNNGVQTEGDAQRAWNELMSNINDTALVQQRLKEIQGINKRAADLHRLRVDSVRGNYGAPPLDVSDYRSQPPAVGDDARQPGGVRTIKNDAEYNALPSGATFVGPDGKTRRKP